MYKSKIAVYFSVVIIALVLMSCGDKKDSTETKTGEKKTTETKTTETKKETTEKTST